MSNISSRVPFRLKLTLLFTVLLLAVETSAFAVVAVILTAARGFDVTDEPWRDGQIFVFVPSSEAVRPILWTIAGAFIVIAAFGALAAWWLTGVLLRPLGRIVETARSINGSDLQARIEVKGPADEIRQVSETLNGMLDRVQELVRRKELFAANASHELRTPLAALKTILQVSLRETELDREVLVEAHRLTDEMVSITSVLLELATPVPRRQPELVAIDKLIADALEAVRWSASERRIAVHHERGAGELYGDPALLRRLIALLVSNSITHNVEGGSTWVHAERSAKTVDLVFENTSAELTKVDFRILFEPFQRARRVEGGHHGHGLGLSIARSIAEASGASLKIGASPEGNFVVHVCLPVGAFREL